MTQVVYEDNSIGLEEYVNNSNDLKSSVFVIQNSGQSNTTYPKLQNNDAEKQDVIEYYSSGEKAEHFTSVEDLLNNLDAN